MVYHALQFEGEPVIVGPAGVVSWLTTVETTAARAIIACCFIVSGMQQYHAVSMLVRHEATGLVLPEDREEVVFPKLHDR